MCLIGDRIIEVLICEGTQMVANHLLEVLVLMAIVIKITKALPQIPNRHQIQAMMLCGIGSIKHFGFLQFFAFFFL